MIFVAEQAVRSREALRNTLGKNPHHAVVEGLAAREQQD
jgi:hypothetical protein